MGEGRLNNMNENEKKNILEAVDEAKTMLDAIQQSISNLDGNDLLPLINRVAYLEKEVMRITMFLNRWAASESVSITTTNLEEKTPVKADVVQMEAINNEIDNMDDIPDAPEKKKLFSKKKQSPYKWEKIKDGNMNKGETQIWKYKDRSLVLSMKNKRMVALIDGSKEFKLDRQKDLVKLQKNIEDEVNAI